MLGRGASDTALRLLIRDNLQSVVKHSLQQFRNDISEPPGRPLAPLQVIELVLAPLGVERRSNPEFREARFWTLRGAVSSSTAIRINATGVDTPMRRARHRWSPRYRSSPRSIGNTTVSASGRGVERVSTRSNVFALTSRSDRGE
jgi:hypothetical protein